MTILKNILLIVLPYVLVLAIGNIGFGLLMVSESTFEIGPKALIPIITGLIIFFYLLFLIKICPVKNKSTMICCIFGAITSVLVPCLYWMIPVSTGLPALYNEAGIAAVIFVLAYIFCIISYCRKEKTNRI